MDLVEELLVTQLLIAMVVLTPTVAGARLGSGTGRLLAMVTDALAAVPRGALPHEVHAEVAEALLAGLESSRRRDAGGPGRRRLVLAGPERGRVSRHCCHAVMREAHGEAISYGMTMVTAPVALRAQAEGLRRVRSQGVTVSAS